MMGLKIKVKGLDKTDYSAVQYKGGIAHNLEGIHSTLPDGINVPQLTVPVPDSDPLKAAYSTGRARADRKAKARVATATANNTTDTKEWTATIYTQ